MVVRNRRFTPKEWRCVPVAAKAQFRVDGLAPEVEEEQWRLELGFVEHRMAELEDGIP